MSDVDVFVIDDDFDPLADIGIAEEDEGKTAPDYLPPIPDADKSVVPEPVELPAAERIEKLLAGLPGQQFRALCAVQACADAPRTMDELAAAVDEAFPDTKSVFSAAQLVRLLERDGAIERVEDEGDGAAAGEGAAPAPVEPAQPGFIEVTPAAPARYIATAAGLDAVAARASAQPAIDAVGEELRYLPLYERVLAMCDREGGCPTKELDAAVDSDPLCEEPRRFCGFFRGRLEETGAIAWRGTWTTTDLGRAVLASGVFGN